MHRYNLVFRFARVCSLFLFLALPLQAFAENGEGFHLFFDTPGINPKLGSFVSVDVGTYENLDQLPTALTSAKSTSGESLSPLMNAVRVVVVVPKGASKDYVDSYVAKVRRVMAPHVKEGSLLDVVPSYIDTEAKLREVEDTLKGARELAAAEEDAEDRQVYEEGIGRLEKGRDEVRTWRSTWFGRPIEWLNNTNPLHRTKAAWTIASLKGVLAASIMVFRYGMHLSTAGIGLLAGGITSAFGFYATEWSQWVTTHRLLFTRRFPWIEKLPFIGAPIRAYNDIPEVKTNVINFTRSIGINFFIKWLCFISEQQDQRTGKVADSPAQWSFFANIFGLALIENLADSANYVGLRALTQKKYITYMGRSYALWGISLPDTAMHGFIRTGNTDIAYTICGLNTCVKSAVYIVGKALPRQMPQVVVISDAIPRLVEGADGKMEKSKDFDLVLKQHALDESWRLRVDPEVDEYMHTEAHPNEVAKGLNLVDISADDLMSLMVKLQEQNVPLETACADAILKHRAKPAPEMAL